MSVVYFIQSGDGGPIKIGVATNATFRLVSLQCGNPVELSLLATIPGSQVEERLYHRVLSAHRIRGEWFAPHPDVLAMVGKPVAIVAHEGPRTHSEIVSKAGPDALAELRGVSLHTARSWAQRNSIPAEHWQSLVVAGHASLEELAAAAAATPRPRPSEQSSAAA